MAKTDVIVPTRNGLSDSIAMYESLKKTTSDFRLIIVDNHSEDGTPEYFEGRGEKVIRLPENLGFGAAINRGLEVLEAPNVVLLNNDTILTQGWLDKLLAYKNSFPAPIAGIGPVSNYAGGRQGIRYDNSDPEAFAQKVAKDAAQSPLTETSFLSFFCALLDSEAVKSVGPLEEWFPGGYEDNSYCTRCWEAGWRLLISRDTFVFHKGSRTIIREFGDSKEVFRHRLDFLEKHLPTTEPKIVALYRAKNDEANLRRSLEQTSKVVDAIYIFDDNSNPPLKKLADSFPKVERYYHSTMAFDEYRDRSMLLAWAKASKYDWALVLDSDEVLESAVTYKKLHDLVKTPDPLIRSFVFFENTFWFDNFYRMDGIWKWQAHDRLFKLNANQ